MTLPTTTILPLHSERIKEGGEDLDSYLRELVFTLQRQYEDIAQAVNGDIRNDVSQGSKQFLPTLNGSTPGTFTYTKQVGWVLRQGLMVDVWGDVAWSSAGTAAGNLFVELPYKVAISETMPFVGIVQPSAVVYTGGTGIVINAIGDTYRGEFWNVGDGFTTANQSVVAAGRLIFHIRYLGQGIER
jgi:hypothetical protein